MSFIEKNKYKIISLKNFSELAEDNFATIQGRIVFFRDLGKLVFAKIYDINGIAQFSLSKQIVANFDDIVKNVKMGDFVSVSGFIYRTKAGELTLQTENLVILNKALKNLPDKWSGLKDEELKLRYRYLDLIHDEQTRERFFNRFTILNGIRSFMQAKSFVEVETPILQNIASGAAANPFITHHDALDMKMYLRIAPEMFLKRLMVGGFTSIFEIAKCFRNEGIDPTHLQEFTMLECYKAYMSYEELQDFAIELFQTVVKLIHPTMKFKNMDCSTIEKISYKKLLRDFGGIEFHSDIESLRTTARSNGLDITQYKSVQALQDAIYKKVCVAKIVNPVLVYDYPKAPLAKISDSDSDCSDQFQIVVNKQEVVKACIEMISAEQQRKNFDMQAQYLEDGDSDVVRRDEDFLQALEYGMPPTAGLGMGLDRIICLLTEADSLRDIVFFPNIKSTV